MDEDDDEFDDDEDLDDDDDDDEHFHDEVSFTDIVFLPCTDQPAGRLGLG